MVRFWLAAVAAFALDQYTKHLIVAGFAEGESRIVIPHVLFWTYVQNRAGAFGLFGTQPWLLVGMAVAVLGVFYFAFREQAANSALVGGAIGNIVDRFHYGYVVDFIDLRWWPVFNAADSCITVGVALLLIASLQRDRAAPKLESSRGR
jgi:signal peptidase II